MGGYVYTITNIFDHKFYVGSTKSPKSRKIKHFYYLRAGRHCCKKLQDAFTQHVQSNPNLSIWEAETNFVFTVIEEFDTTLAALRREQELLDEFWGKDELYNTKPKTGAGMSGHTHTVETKAKMSAAIRPPRLKKLKVYTPTNTKKVEIEGISYISCADAARKLGVSPATITYRFKHPTKYPNYKYVDDIPLAKIVFD